MNRNIIALFAAAALLVSCGGDKKTAEQPVVQPVLENEVAMEDGTMMQRFWIDLEK